MKDLVLIAHNLRSSHNVGSLLRTAEGLGVAKVIFSGYTPYPLMKNDPRMPHISRKIHAQIIKTSLGAEDLIAWEHTEDIAACIKLLKSTGYTICALEQSPESIPLISYKTPQKCALIIGREVEGIEPDILEMCDVIVEIPMHGSKESFNVVQAAAMALYQFQYMPKQ